MLVKTEVWLAQFCNCHNLQGHAQLDNSMNNVKDKSHSGAHISDFFQPMVSYFLWCHTLVGILVLNWVSVTKRHEALSLCQAYKSELPGLHQFYKLLYTTKPALTSLYVALCPLENKCIQALLFYQVTIHLE